MRCPVLAYYVESDWSDACEKCIAVSYTHLIVDSLRAKNPSLAAKMMTAHLSHVEGFRTKI